jgi:hypothetical protein
MPHALAAKYSEVVADSVPSVLEIRTWHPALLLLARVVYLPLNVLHPGVDW